MSNKDKRLIKLFSIFILVFSVLFSPLVLNNAIATATSESNISITSPSGSNVYWRGNQTIQWANLGSGLPPFSIFYSKNLGGYQNIINNESGLSYEWDTKTATGGDGDYQIKVTNSSSEFGISSVFTIDNTNPTLVVNNATEKDPLQTDTINITTDDVTSGVLSQEYGFSADSTCDGLDDTYGNSFTSAVDFDISGDHTDYLCAKATDKAGNIEYQLVGKLNTDNTAPTISSVVGTTVQAGDDTIKVVFDEPVVAVDGTFSANEFDFESPSGSALTITNAVFSYDSGTKTLTVTLDEATDDEYLKNGDVVKVIPATDTVKDIAGNFLGTTPVESSAITGDVLAPTVTLTYSPDRQVKAGDVVTITATFNETLEGTPEISISTQGDGGLSATSMTGSGFVWTYDWTVPAGADDDGTATVSINTTDLAGNTNETATNNERTIDNTAPTISAYTLDGQASDAFFNPGAPDSVEIILNADEPVKYNRIYVCDVTDVTCDDTTEIKRFTQTGSFNSEVTKSWNGMDKTSAQVSDGEYKIKVKIVDEAGNETIEVLTPYTVTVDTVNPTISISSPVADQVVHDTDGSVDFSFNPSDLNLYSCSYKVNNGSFVDFLDCTSPQTVTLADGRQTITIMATDKAGNYDTASVDFVVDTDGILTVDDTSANNPDFPTIQEAIDAWVTGITTIDVAAGTYNVTAAPGITVNQSLTISGAGAGATIISGDNKNGSVVNGEDTLFYVTASDVTIKNLTVDLGDSDSDYDVGILTPNSGGIDNLTVQDNTFLYASFGNAKGEQLVHLGGGSGATISGNTMETASGNSTIYAGDGANSSLTITNNKVSPIIDADGGGTFFNQMAPLTDSTFSGNSFTDTGIAIYLGSGNTNTDTITVENNTFTSNNGHPAGYGAISITSEDDGANTQNITIRGNTFRGSQVASAITIFDSVNISAPNVIGSTITIVNNKFNGDNFGGVNVGGGVSGTVDAEKNWWGDITGPTHTTLNPAGTGDSVSDNADFSPFCLDEGCTTFGSVDSIASLTLEFNPNPSAINSNSDLTVTAYDSEDYLVVNNSSSKIQLSADGGASFGANLLTLTVNGTTSTTITNDKVGTVNVSANLTGSSVATSGQVTFSQSDTIAPAIESHTPADNNQDAAVTVIPQIKFTKGLNSSTVNSSNIQLRLYSDNSQIPATVSLVEGGKTVLITPNSSLQNGTQYYFFVNNSVLDTVGNALSNPIGEAEKASNEFKTITLEPIVVDNIVSVSGTASPNNTYVDGWHYTYYLTINATDETDLFVRFNDWLNTDDGTSTIPANGNMRLLFNRTTGGGLGSIVGGLTEDNIVNGFGSIDSYELGNNFSDQKLSSVASAISTLYLGIGLDNDTASGRQIRFDVFTKIPEGTTAGAYETDYEIQLGNK